MTTTITAEDLAKLRANAKIMAALEGEGTADYRADWDEAKDRVDSILTGSGLLALLDQLEEAERDAAKATAQIKRDAEYTRLGMEIQRAAGELPDGWMISVDLMHESGTVQLFDGECNEVELSDDHDAFSYHVTEAIAAAIATQGEKENG